MNAKKFLPMIALCLTFYCSAREIRAALLSAAYSSSLAEINEANRAIAQVLQELKHTTKTRGKGMSVAEKEATRIYIDDLRPSLVARLLRRKT